MDIITDDYDNMSIGQLYAKLSMKHAQVGKLEQKDAIQSVSKKDYIEQSAQTEKYDREDFARVLEKFKQTDKKIRTQEQIDASIGRTTTPISYNYQKESDSKIYKVGENGRFDASIQNTKKIAAFKLDQIQKAVSGVSDSTSSNNEIATQTNLNKILLQLKGEDNAS